MYEAHWGLSEKPFENTPDPKFIYYSEQHREALSRLLYVVQEYKAAALLSGEYGSGKTLLSRVLLQELKKENHFKVVSIYNPRLSSLEFIREIVYQLDGEGENLTGKIDLLHLLEKLLLSNKKSGKHTVVLIDEAQAISDNDIFEELRLLLNFQLDNAYLLTIILIGQPELIEKVVNMPQLKQRISVKFHLRALDEAETKGYIQQRLKVSGVAGEIFEEESYKQLYICSGGIPREINNLADLVLLAGFSAGLRRINKELVLRASEDMQLLSPSKEEKKENGR
ncbi:MAG: AAA family ATPase [Candidatus Omnitrophota bacterium]